MSRYIPVTEYLRKVRWCEKHGWTEPYFSEGKWYGFPPGAFISSPLPPTWWDWLKLLSLLGSELIAIVLYTLSAGIIWEMILTLR